MSDLDRLAQAARDVQRVSAYPPRVIHVHHESPRHYTPLQWGFGIGVGVILAWLTVTLIMWLLGVGLFAAGQIADEARHSTRPPPGPDWTVRQP